LTDQKKRIDNIYAIKLRNAERELERKQSEQASKVMLLDIGPNEKDNIQAEYNEAIIERAKLKEELATITRTLEKEERLLLDYENEKKKLEEAKIEKIRDQKLKENELSLRVTELKNKIEDKRRELVDLQKKNANISKSSENEGEDSDSLIVDDFQNIDSFASDEESDLEKEKQYIAKRKKELRDLKAKLIERQDLWKKQVIEGASTK
jgi:hypothetical protein